MSETEQTVYIEGVGAVSVPAQTSHSHGDFPNMYMRKEEMILQMWNLEKRLEALETAKDSAWQKLEVPPQKPMTRLAAWLMQRWKQLTRLPIEQSKTQNSE